MALSDYEAIMAAKMRDATGLIDPVDRQLAIAEAVDRYSRLRPRRRIQEVTGTGAFDYALAADFEEGFSSLEAVEHPVGRQEPEYLDGNDVRLYRNKTTGALMLRLLRQTLATGAKAYVAYTARHVVNASTDTVPGADRTAVATQAAALGLRALAAHYTHTKDPTISADVVDYQAKGRQFLDLARDLERDVQRHLGVSADGIAAASAVADLDVFLQGGWDRFFHGHRTR